MDLEEELRLKEKSVRAREERIRLKQAELSAERDDFNIRRAAAIVRENFIEETEKEHGSIAQRRAELQLKTVELETLKAAYDMRIEELREREGHFELLMKHRKDEIEELLVPLETREIDVTRREELLASNEEEYLEKMRAFRAKMRTDEALLDAKEVKLRDQEIWLKDQTSRVEKKHRDVDTLQQELISKRQQIIQEQSMLDARERDVLTREAGSRNVMDEVNAAKMRLHDHELQLGKKEERLSVHAEELKLQQQQQEQKETGISERYERIFALEKNLKDRQHIIDKHEAEGEALEAAAKKKYAEVMVRENAITERESNLQKTAAAQERQKVKLEEKAADIESRVKALVERERKLKEWLIEIGYRDAALSHKEGAPLPYLRSADTRDLVPQQFNTGIINMQLESVEESYLASRAHKGKAAATGKSRPEANGGSSDGGTLDATRVDGYEEAIETGAVFKAIEGHVADMETHFVKGTASFLMLDQQVQDRVFSGADKRMVLETVAFEEEVRDEVQFLDELGKKSPMENHTGNVVSVDHLAAMVEWFVFVRRIATERRKRMLGERLRRLTAANKLFQEKSREFPDMFNPVAAVHNRSALVSFATQDDPSTLSPNGRSKPGRARLQQSIMSSGKRSEGSKNPARAGQLKPLDREPAVADLPVAMAPRGSKEKVDDAYKRAIDQLPDYLRRHYQTQHSPSAAAEADVKRSTSGAVSPQP